MDELNKQVEPNPIKALQGRIPGVQISTDGSPSGGNTAILIRGVGTLNNTSPLFVIDGVSIAFCIFYDARNKRSTIGRIK